MICLLKKMNPSLSFKFDWDNAVQLDFGIDFLILFNKKKKQPIFIWSLGFEKKQFFDQ
jgi:hypothetical protein